MNNARLKAVLFFQIPIIILGFIFKLNTITGYSVFLIRSWNLLACFFLVLSVIDLFKKKYSVFFVDFFLALASVCIYGKGTFWHYNIVAHILVLILLSFFRFSKRYSLERPLKIVLSIFLVFNLTVLFLSDIAIAKFWHRESIPFTRRCFDWTFFQKRSLKQRKKTDRDATIKPVLFYKISECYNYKPAIVFAITNPLDNYHYVESDNLLKHEYYHFKITELVAKMANFELNKHAFLSAYQTQVIINEYVDLERNLNRLYDIQTNHNLNDVEQKKWEKKVDYLFNVFK